MSTTEQINFLKDCVCIAGPVILLTTFVWKLVVDTKLARYRETISFLEKKDDVIKKEWTAVKTSLQDLTPVMPELKDLMARLELISMLVRKKGFDGEIVYSYWWKYFDEPLSVPSINAWIKELQQKDASVLCDYVLMCKKWADRLDREQGRLQLSWFKRVVRRLNRKLPSLTQ